MCKTFHVPGTYNVPFFLVYTLAELETLSTLSENEKMKMKNERRKERKTFSDEIRSKQDGMFHLYLIFYVQRRFDTLRFLEEEVGRQIRNR